GARRGDHPRTRPRRHDHPGRARHEARHGYFRHGDGAKFRNQDRGRVARENAGRPDRDRGLSGRRRAAMTMLSIAGLCSGYGKIAVLHEVALSIERGQIVTLIGANGAGKTTLLKTISGLIRPTAGTIEFEGKSIARRPPHKIVSLGLSQVPEGRAILKRMTVLDNLRMGAFTRRDAQIGRDIEAVFP